MKQQYLLSLFMFFLLLSTTSIAAQDIMVSGAGTPGVNGVYVENGTYQGKPLYTKGTYSIRFDCNYACEGWHIVENQYNAFYYSEDDVDSPVLVTNWNFAMGNNPAPTVQFSGLSVNAPAIITSNTAFLGGYVPDDTGNPVTERGIVYSLNENPTVADTKIVMGSGSGQFSQTVSGFAPSTKYYVRVFATASGIITYTDQVTFYTFAGGDGTVGSPLKIENWIQLDNVRSGLTGHYKLIKNIDQDTEGFQALASTTANTNTGWQALGNFKGTFDGQNYSIKGVYINRPNLQSLGLFDALSGSATVRNLVLIDFSITGNVNNGALAGVIDGGSVLNCHVLNVMINSGGYQAVLLVLHMLQR